MRPSLHAIIEPPPIAWHSWEANGRVCKCFFREAAHMLTSCIISGFKFAEMGISMWFNSSSQLCFKQIYFTHRSRTMRTYPCFLIRGHQAYCVERCYRHLPHRRMG